MVATYEGLFGREAVHVMVFEAFVADPARELADLAAWMDVDAAPFLDRLAVGVPVRNPSPTRPEFWIWILRQSRLVQGSPLAEVLNSAARVRARIPIRPAVTMSQTAQNRINAFASAQLRASRSGAVWRLRNGVIRWNSRITRPLTRRRQQLRTKVLLQQGRFLRRSNRRGRCARCPQIRKGLGPDVHLSRAPARMRYWRNLRPRRRFPEAELELVPRKPSLSNLASAARSRQRSLPVHRRCGSRIRQGTHPGRVLPTDA